MNAAPEFHTREELVAHYKGVRERLFNPAKRFVPPRPPPPKPETVLYSFPPRRTTAADFPSELPAALMADLANDLPSMPAIARFIIRKVARKHRLDPRHIIGPSRLAIVVQARQEAMLRLHKLRFPNGNRRFSLPQIGRYLRRDHTTVLHAIRKHKAGGEP